MKWMARTIGVSVIGVSALLAAPEPDPQQLLGRLQAGMTPEQVRQILGPPQRIARQFLYQRHLEQWIYDRPTNVRLEFECPRGRESHLDKWRTP